jgi:hypothetical protein
MHPGGVVGLAPVSGEEAEVAPKGLLPADPVRRSRPIGYVLHRPATQGNRDMGNGITPPSPANPRLLRDGGIRQDVYAKNQLD